jgi:pyruvate kinase
MLRKTKIVATLGPASSDPATLARMIEAGVDVVRMNFSHGTAKEHAERVANVKSIAKNLGRTVGILVDLQGPKIRIGKFKDGKITLQVGDKFILDAKCTIGNGDRVGLDYKELPKDVKPDDILLLDDGRIEMHVTAVKGEQVHCVVIRGGVLSNNKGINRKGGGLTAPALTEKDIADIQTAADLGCDFLAVSFPRSGADMWRARDLMREAGGKAMLIAKIERAEAIEALDEILDASDAIMVARGDLAVEVGDAVVPALQKRMIRAARLKNKAVITATQMMESMISSPVPTRAEVSDVANAAIDGTDAVMLSAETAAGQFPVEAVEAMVRVLLEAEKEKLDMLDRRTATHTDTSGVEGAIAHAAIFTANHLPVRAIAALTHSGKTALLMSRMNADVPIYALSPSIETRRKVTLFRGVYPIRFKHSTVDPEEIMNLAQEDLLKREAVNTGDLIVLTIGEPIGKPGGTNTMKIIKIGEHQGT